MLLLSRAVSMQHPILYLLIFTFMVMGQCALTPKKPHMSQNHLSGSVRLLLHLGELASPAYLCVEWCIFKLRKVS